MEFFIDLSPESETQLDDLTARQRRIVLDEIDVQLRHQPNVGTRRRKSLDPNKPATWELRVGDFRVFYDVEIEPKSVVLRVCSTKVDS